MATDQLLPTPEGTDPIPSSPLTEVESETENIGEETKGSVNPGTDAQPQLRANDGAAKGPKDEEEQVSTKPEERTFFFKQSWTESTRHKEFEMGHQKTPCSGT